MTKKIASAVASLAAVCLAAASAAQAALLKIVDVGAPEINCVFHEAGMPDCTVVVDDSFGTFTVPGDNGEGQLQSRTYAGVAPASGAGTMAYVYRVDLTAMPLAANCVTKLALDFGAVEALIYGPQGYADVFVVIVGSLGNPGSAKLSSADKVGNEITFTFDIPVCPGETSFFFGLASKSLNPKPGTATLFYSGGGNATTADRVP
jgi:hypothetical protein